MGTIYWEICVSFHCAPMTLLFWRTTQKTTCNIVAHLDLGRVHLPSCYNHFLLNETNPSWFVESLHWCLFAFFLPMSRNTVDFIWRYVIKWTSIVYCEFENGRICMNLSEPDTVCLVNRVFEGTEWFVSQIYATTSGQDVCHKIGGVK